MNRIAGLLGHPSLSSIRVMELWQEYEARESVHKHPPPAHADAPVNRRRSRC